MQTRHRRRPIARLLSASLLLGLSAAMTHAAQFDIDGPPGSGAFGSYTLRLPNGNFIVTDPEFSSGPADRMGALYLYSPEGTLLSRLTGSQAGDAVGQYPESGYVTVLANGDFVVCSPNWDNGGNADAGAVTQLDGDGGFFGAVSAANSLVGTQAGDRVGNACITPLANGNYVVSSGFWHYGAAANAGAVTWVDADIGIAGAVSANNSLVGTSADDYVSGVRALSNGNYVVVSYAWDDGDIVDAGSVTWGSGDHGVTGTVSAANSLIGASADDEVGQWSLYPLSNGDYVVVSASWDRGSIVNAGAVTWGDGDVGVVGRVSIANSLVGSQANDTVGLHGIIELANGNYVVKSAGWNHGSIIRAGAATWCAGGAPLSGEVSPANSLVGSSEIDMIGVRVTPLPNGHYVTASDYWDNGAAEDAGAATWADGTTGISGVVSASNSLVGTITDDRVGAVTVLRNGHYVIVSDHWDNGAIADVGAVTWVDSDVGLRGTITPANSLVGSSLNDRVGTRVTALANGNYVVSSFGWTNGSAENAGAVTWADGDSGITGAVSPQNSLVGTGNDWVGMEVYALASGDYVVTSEYWDNGPLADVGAATWVDGDSGLTGTISAANSLIGANAGDQIGAYGVRELPNGNYLVSSIYWSTTSPGSMGALTWGSGNGGVRGVVSAANSLLGSTEDDRIGYLTTTLANGNYLIANPAWDHGSTYDVGSVTWADGSSGAVGTVTPANSLFGSSDNDAIGGEEGLMWTIVPSAFALEDGNYALRSATWDNGALVDAGAVSLVRGDRASAGPLDAATSVLGTMAGGGARMNFVYDADRETLIVGQPAANRVSLLTLPGEALFGDGFE